MRPNAVRGTAAGVAVFAVVASGMLTSWWDTVPIAADDLRSRTCQLAVVAVDDPSEAADGFMSSVHGPMHTVAADLMTTDRPAAARLLEAKLGVERAIDTDDLTMGSDLPARLAELAERLPGATSCEEI
ncbi:hypothetical protein FTX61_19630 [Nitriliruptoraceae bacterium ZYF776]|nr:hypothetical protein [Profundirhabdus halotolerans]